MPAQPTRRRVEPGIYERLDADGRRTGLEVVWKADGRTHRRAVAGTTLTDARNALAQARTRRVAREVEPVDVRVTFDSVADAFERSHVAGLRPNSQATYGAALRRLRETFGPRRMTTIDKLAVREFIADERAEGLKAGTILAHLNVLGALFSFARDDLDMPVTMPRLKASERPRPEDDRREHRVLTDAELARVLAACPERSRLYFRTLAETGARASEILGLTSRRVRKDTITIAEQAGRGGELAPLKTRNSRRTIEVTKALAAELKLAASASSGRVFDHLTHGTVRHDWHEARERAELDEPRPTVHDLRHTHVSGLVADGWDLVEVAGRIGDTLKVVLSVYAHEFDQVARSARRRAALEARYGGRMATSSASWGMTADDGLPGEVADLQAIREAP